MDAIPYPAHSGSLVSNRSVTFRQAREKMGYSVEDLAVSTGLTHDEILDVENGRDDDQGRLQRIAAVLQIEL